MKAFERIAVALRHGVLVQRKATMSYTAHVVRCATEARQAKRFDVGPILAVDEREAAQHAALVVARRLFPPSGEVSFFQHAGDRYLAVAGNYRFQNGYGVNVGVSLSIRVEKAAPVL